MPVNRRRFRQLVVQEKSHIIAQLHLQFSARRLAAISPNIGVVGDAKD